MPPVLILTWALSQLGYAGQSVLVAERVDGPAWVMFKGAESDAWDTLGFVPGPFVAPEFLLLLSFDPNMKVFQVKEHHLSPFLSL